MTVEQFKRDLAALIGENRNREAVELVAATLPLIKEHMTSADRMMVADWMEGVAIVLDLESSSHRGAPEHASPA